MYTPNNKIKPYVLKYGNAVIIIIEIISFFPPISTYIPSFYINIVRTNNIEPSYVAHIPQHICQAFCSIFITTTFIFFVGIGYTILCKNKTLYLTERSSGTYAKIYFSFFLSSDVQSTFNIATWNSVKRMQYKGMPVITEDDGIHTPCTLSNDNQYFLKP